MHDVGFVSLSDVWLSLPQYENIIDYHSYTHNLAVVKLKPKKIQPCMGFEPITSAIPVQCSTNWAIKSSGSSWSNCEFVIYPKKVKNVNEYMKDHIFELRRKMETWLIITVIHATLSSCEIKAWKIFISFSAVQICDLSYIRLYCFSTFSKHFFFL